MKLFIYLLGTICLRISIFLPFSTFIFEAPNLEVVEGDKQEVFVTIINLNIKTIIFCHSNNSQNGNYIVKDGVDDVSNPTENQQVHSLLPKK